MVRRLGFSSPIHLDEDVSKYDFLTKQAFWV